MKGSWVYVAILGVGLAATTATAQSAKLTDKDVAGIKASTGAFAKGVLAAEYAAVSNLYTETASFLPPHEKALAGRAPIEAWMKGLPPVKEFKLDPVEIDGRGDLAFVKGTFTLTLLPPGAPGPITDVGKYVEIRRRQADGSWLIAVDIFNSDLPPPQ
jgi:ketosteroid isomerase-like protein